MGDNQKGLSQEELDAESAGRLPDKQAMSTLGDLGGELVPNSLLDVDVNLDLDADVAAPIDAAVAANANVAAPIDAAVSANVLSPGAVAYASAEQDSTIIQDLDGTATATATQDADIAQGDTESSSTATT